MTRCFRSLPYVFALTACVACGGQGASGPGTGSLADDAARRFAPTPATSSGSCPNPGLGAMNETWTLNASAFTIPLPPNPPWAGTVAFPTSSPSGLVVSETDDQDNFNYAPTSSPEDPHYGRRTKDLFMTLRFSEPATFGGGGTPLVPIELVSTCLTSGTTYYLDVFAGDRFVSSETGVASAGSVTVNVEVKPNPFPAGVYINAILSH